MERHRLIIAVAVAVALAVLSWAVPYGLQSSPAEIQRPAPVSTGAGSQVILRFEIAPGLHLTGRYRLEPETVAQGQPLQGCRCTDTLDLSPR